MTSTFTGVKKQFLEKMPCVLWVLPIQVEERVEDVHEGIQQRHTLRNCREDMACNFAHRIGVDKDQKLGLISGVEKQRSCADACCLGNLACGRVLISFLLKETPGYFLDALECSLFVLLT